MMIRKRSLLWFFLSIFFISITILWWFVMGLYQDYRNIPSHYLAGNRPSAVETLKAEGLPFSFFVIGDTSGSETTETLIEMALKTGPPSFMVILGDFVREPDIWNHRFFMTETAEINPTFPIFLVAGNHDIDYPPFKIKNNERRVTREIYESLYGQINFDFTFNGCLFIICGIDLEKPTQYLNYLRDTLIKKGGGKKHIFVFIHYPPKGLANYIEGSLLIPNEEEFFSVLETYKVTTCFFGDHHGYWRGQRGGVNLIVSGGGGRLKKSQPEWGKFHHILRMTIGQDQVSEEIITIQGEMEWKGRFEKWVFMNLFPIIQDSAGSIYLIFAILLMISGSLLFKLFKLIRCG